MSPSPSPQYWLNKKAHRKTGFPLATIAYYGPDDKFSSKVVVGIILQGRKPTDSSLERWFSDAADFSGTPSRHRPANSRFHPGASR